MSFWSTVDAAGNALPPRAYSTGLTQDEAVRRIVSHFRRAKAQGRGADVFFHAGTGSGKSLVALNVAARVGRAIINIPTVNLQMQYEEDYQGGRVGVLKPDGRPLRLVSVMGRARYECAYEGGTAAEAHPCNASSKDKESRWRKASKCSYWSPVMPREAYENLLRSRPQETGFREGLQDHHVKFLESLEDGAHTYSAHEGEYVHLGARGCAYFDAHLGFATADVVLLNNRKWEIETELGRKPRVEVEVFDECDHFLDGLFEMQTLTREAMDVLFSRIDHAAKILTLEEHQLRDPARLPEYEANSDRLPAHLREGFNALRSLMRRLATYKSPKDFSDEKTWKALSSTQPLLKELPRLARERMHLEFSGHPWATLHVESTLDTGGASDQEENIIARILHFVESRDAIELAYDEEGVHLAYSTFAGPLKKLMEKSAPLRLWMSATLPPKDILEKVYGFRDALIVDGEPRMQGVLKLVEPPVDVPAITFKTWQEKKTREQFARALDAFTQTIPPDEKTITIVHGQSRLIDVQEISRTARWMVEEIEQDGLGHEKRLAAFVSPDGPNHLVSTRLVRGVDLKGEKCRNIILLKDPIPNINDGRYQILKKKWPEPLFWAYVSDVADRTLIQMVGRGLRSADDWVRVWCLDAKIAARLERATRGKLTFVREGPPAPTRRPA